MKFMLLHYADETAAMDAEQLREDQVLLASWLEDTIARGVNLQGSYLQPSRTAATVRARDGDLLVTDGPFAETKEQLLGFFVVECASPEQAVETAEELGLASSSGGSYEIRPLRLFRPGGLQT